MPTEILPLSAPKVTFTGDMGFLIFPSPNGRIFRYLLHTSIEDMSAFDSRVEILTFERVLTCR